MRPPADVLACYPAEVASECEFLADAGGLSGARLWRLSGPAGTWCLKAWPTATTSGAQLAFGHQLMDVARRAGLTYVPHVLLAGSARTFVERGDWFWDVVSWQPGQAVRLPSETQLAAAGRALAQAHGVWAAAIHAHGPCPGVARRLQALAAFDPKTSCDPQREPLASLVGRAAPALVDELARWRDVPVPLSPCLCDLRRDHVLFEGSEVTGLIDFGAARIDHPANDLARYLGDTLGGDLRSWRPLLDAYAEIRPLTLRDYELIGVLERSGAVASAIHWLGRCPPQTPAFEQRIADLYRRLQRV